MKNTAIAFCLLLSTSALAASFASAASVEKAQMLSAHGLKDDAKKELIDVVFGKTTDKNKSHAYYLLGNMAFEENNVKVALDAWNTLADTYPKSEHALLVKDRIQQLAEIVSETAKETVNDAVALAYLRNGDFWAVGESRAFAIDTQFIPRAEAANKWYDKVIAEFPGTVAARIAYESKFRIMFTIWEASALADRDKNAEELIDLFSHFEKKFPRVSTLQSFRYQIAHVYWERSGLNRDREYLEAKSWLQAIIDNAGDGDSFYKDLAERRLANL